MSEFFDFRFPHKGLNLDRGFGQPIQGATRQAVNVRSCESATKRMRGGTRAGLIKYIPDQLPSEPQLLDVITHVRDLSEIEFIQAAVHSYQTGTITFPEDVTENALLLVMISAAGVNGTPPTFPTIELTDNLGNTWDEIARHQSDSPPSSIQHSLFMCHSIASGACTVTASLGASDTAYLMVGVEFFGAGARRNTVDNEDSESTDYTATTGLLDAFYGDLKIGFFDTDTNFDLPADPATNFEIAYESNYAAGRIIVAYHAPAFSSDQEVEVTSDFALNFSYVALGATFAGDI